MKIKEVNIMRKLILLMMVIMLSSFVLAGVGIKWSQESAVINENGKACMSYEVYNPWPEDTFVTIELSGELKEILTLQEVETKLIPADTPSSNAIPVEFCFKVPKVYERDCWIFGLICEQDCNEEQKIYSGEVLVKSVASEINGGGSATTMAVSAPLNIKIQCIAHARDFTLIYVLGIIISIIIIAVLLSKRYRKPKSERDKEKLQKLKKKIKKETNK